MLDFNALGKYRENNRIEAKKAQGGLPRSIWETYSAFANTVGGIILLGVVENPDKSFSSVPLASPEGLVHDFWNGVNNRAIASVNILSEHNVQIVESGGNRIVVIDVPRADRQDKPVYIGLDPFSGSYRRNGEGDYHCSRDEVRAMMRDQAEITQDARVMEKMTMDVFAPDTIQRYRRRMETLRPGHVWSDLENREFLHRIGAMARDEQGVLRPTAAGLLIFGYEYEIVREFPHYFLDYQEHDALESTQNRWVDRLVSNSGDWSGNLYDFFFQVYGRLVRSLKVPFQLSGIDRIDDTPLHQAIREALANALIHADYYDRRGLVVQKWPNQIKIANPGSFRINLQEAFSGGVSDPRNATLIKMFNLINIGERAGSGLPSIRTVWQKQGWQDPEIVESFGPDRTTLSLPVSTEKAAIKTGDIQKTAVESSDNSKKPLIKTGDIQKPVIKTGDNKKSIREQRQEAILSYLTDNVEATNLEIAAFLHLKPSQTRDYLKRLVQDGVVIATGENRGRRYRLKS